MIVSYTIIITWFLGMILYFIKKHLSFLINTMIYMISVIFITNYTTILTMGLHRFKTTNDPIIFIGFILFREFIMPFITIIFVNYFIKPNWKVKVISLLSALTTMELIDVLIIKTKLMYYTHWSFPYEFLFNLSFLLFVFLLAKILLAIKKKEEYKI